MHEPIIDFAKLTVAQALGTLDSAREWLESAEAARRLVPHGPN
jgi:hypothetical protein